ncbi:MAG: ABC transporter permease [Anaerolineales bacterium]
MATQADVFEAGREPEFNEEARKGQSLWVDSYRRLIRNRAAVIGGALVIILVLMAIFAPLIAPKSFSEQVLTDNNKVPEWMFSIFPSMKGYANVSSDYLIGADYVGRDLLSRIIYGARVSLAVAFVGPIISMLVGVTYGSISGYFGGRLDDLMMRVVDVMYAFPSLLFIILLMAFFRSTLAKPDPGSFSYMLSDIDTKMGGMFFIFIGIGVTAWQNMARLTRGQVLSVREKEYVEAAHAIGARNYRVMTKHILPNIIGPLVVAETLAIPSYILTEAFLSFIGLGVNPPTPSWGAMISDGSRVVRSYPNQALFPAIALAITMFAFNFLGDGLRDALDPRLRGTR